MAAAATMLVLVSGACRRAGEGATPGATVPTELPTTTTTDPYAVPAVIDAAYVTRVLAALDALTGEAFRMYVRERQVTPEIGDRIRAAYGSGEIYDLTVRSFEEQKDTRFAAEPGNQLTTVTRLITAAPTCIYAQVVRDFRPVGGTVRDLTIWVGLQHPTVFDDLARHNPTPWIYVVDGFNPNRSAPPNPCAGS